MRPKTRTVLAVVPSLAFLQPSVPCRATAVADDLPLPAILRAPAALASTYYVSPSGSDSNPGSRSAP